jgi:ectoine hydroxylase-related dioxygenase (phytanoyl-CoA dioxygenase family)
MQPDQVESFRENGFVVVPRLIPLPAVAAIADRFEPLFRGQFVTGIYPDEWYWRPELSRDDVTRHMANAWKSDPEIANVVLSPTIAAIAAELAGWSSVRLGQDTLWWKPGNGKAVALHQDDTFMASLDPPVTVTCWVVLDDVGADGGTIEYVAGSHRWPLVEHQAGFHAPDDYRAAMLVSAAEIGVDAPQPEPVAVTAGTGIFHDGRIWHGSALNANPGTRRRSIGIHMLRGDVRYREDRLGYIYGRYKRFGSTALDPSHFPIMWSSLAPATSWDQIPPLCGYEQLDPVSVPS